MAEQPPLTPIWLHPWQIMKFSKIFKIFKDPETGENLILLKDLYSVLTKNGDSIYKHNLRRSIKSYQGGVRTYDRKDCATIKAVLQYLCIHSYTKVCKEILCNIENELLCEEKTSQKSTLALYKLIAKTQIFKHSVLFNSIVFNEDDIHTLLFEHKQYFNGLEWKRICWFENDFSKLVEFRELSYEDIVTLKFSRFQSLLSFKQLCRDWNRSSQFQIRKNNLRYKSQEREHDIHFTAYQVHNASAIASDIKSLIDTYCPEAIENVVSFDVTESQNTNCIWAALIQNGCLDIEYDVLCTRIFYSVKRRHSLYLENIFLLYSHQVEDFFTVDRKISRFSLRDALETKQLCNIASSWQAKSLIDGTIDCEYSDIIILW